MLGQIELELEFTRNGNGEWAAYFLHSSCFRIFVIELGRGRSASQRAVKLTDGSVAGSE